MRKAAPFKDERLYRFRNYPADLYVPPGTSAANRAALAKWGAWINAFGATNTAGRFSSLASADLADSTNISGFAKAYGDFPGYGWYERHGNAEGVLLPQEITEFANSGIMAGMATSTWRADPESEFDGFWGACSTYGSFSYLKYGLMRLFSQLAQDCAAEGWQGHVGRRALRARRRPTTAARTSASSSRASRSSSPTGA